MGIKKTQRGREEMCRENQQNQPHERRWLLFVSATSDSAKLRLAASVFTNRACREGVGATRRCRAGLLQCYNLDWVSRKGMSSQLAPQIFIFVTT